MSSLYAGFIPLPLSLPPVKSLKNLPPATHYMYIAPHEPKNTTADTSRSLLAANVPIDSNEGNLRSLFANHLGGARIERVDYDGDDIIGGAPSSKRNPEFSQDEREKRGKKRKRRDDEAMLESEEAQLPRVQRDLQLVRSGSNAVLVFVDEASQQLAMKAVKRAVAASKKNSKLIEWDNGGMLTGMARYKALHQATCPSPENLLVSVTNYLTTYQTVEASRAKALARAGTVPDADGFVTVTRGARTGPARTEAVTQALEKEKAKAEKRIGDNFYRFQVREKAKERERELRRQFQDDVRKVEKLKARRKARGAG